MTTPNFDLEKIVPLKYKPLVGLIGALLTFGAPTILHDTASLPSPWPLVVAAIFACLTGLGIYRAPYTPQGAMLAPATPAVKAAAAKASVAPVVNPQTGGPYKNPYQ